MIKLSENLFRVIAVKKRPLFRWEITNNCPYRDHRDPLELVRIARENGDLIIAQRRVNSFHFELLAKTPR